MKKLVFSISLLTTVLGFSQTTIYQENFETGNTFTMNTTDLGGASTYNTWLRNNSYAGGSGTLVCLGFPFSFTVNNTPTQPSGITGFPSSNYMHISAQAAISSGITNSSYIPADGTCVMYESNFAKMTAPVSTLGFSNVTFDFWWMCAGSSTAFGELYYSLNGGSTWILKQSNLNNVTNWTQTAFSDPAWDNQSSLMFAFRFVNTIATTAADPSFCVDEIILYSSCTTTTSTMTVTACDSYMWIDGNTYTASNNTATFTLTNVAGCDSIVTLDLTINNATAGTDVQTACETYTWIDGITYTSGNNTATWTLTNQSGCDSLVTLDLTINSVSDINTSANGLTISADNSDASYVWLDCNDNYSIIPGETGQSYTATANGNYAVQLAENGCVDTSACVAITTVGILENSFGDNLLIYPNPTKGNFSIDLGAEYASSVISITDMSGKLIYSKSNTHSQILNLSIEEPAGIYIVSIQAGMNKAVIRLVKK